MLKNFVRVTILFSYGRTANRMIQHTLINAETNKVRHSLFIHPGIPDWGVPATFGYRTLRVMFLIFNKIFPGLIRQVTSDGSTLNPNRSLFWIVSDTGLRVNQLKLSRDWAFQTFSNPSGELCKCELDNVPRNTSGYLVAHVRLGDIWNQRDFKRKDYLPLPIAYYAGLSELIGKPIAFLMEDQHDSKYASELIASCPNSKLLPAGCIYCDFKTLLDSDYVAIATSTFSWFSTWISNQAKSIYVPIYGFLDKRIRPEIDLIDPTDLRYQNVKFAYPEFNDGEEYTNWLFCTRNLILKVSSSPLSKEC